MDEWLHGWLEEHHACSEGRGMDKAQSRNKNLILGHQILELRSCYQNKQKLNPPHTHTQEKNQSKVIQGNFINTHNNKG